MAKKNPADSKYNQKSETVRQPRKLPRPRGNATKNGKIFGNWYKKARGK